jgi:hypothetical protein
VFIMEHTADRVLICETQANDMGLNTDHVSILTKIDGRTPTVETHNFRDVDWEEFCKLFEVKISGFSIPRKLTNQTELTHKCKRLTKAL